MGTIKDLDEKVEQMEGGRLMALARAMHAAGLALEEHRSGIASDLSAYLKEHAFHEFMSVNGNWPIALVVIGGHKETPGAWRIRLGDNVHPAHCILGPVGDLDQVNDSLEAIFGVRVPVEILERTRDMIRLQKACGTAESDLKLQVTRLYYEHVLCVADSMGVISEDFVTPPPAPESIMIWAESVPGGELRVSVQIDGVNDGSCQTAMSRHIVVEVINEDELVGFFKAVKRATRVPRTVARLAIRTAMKALVSRR